MGRKKLIVCNLTFDDNETLEEKILKMFWKKSNNSILL